MLLRWRNIGIADPGSTGDFFDYFHYFSLRGVRKKDRKFDEVAEDGRQRVFMQHKRARPGGLGIWGW